MAAAETLYAAKFKGPEFLAQGRINTITCPLRRSAAAVTPDSGGTVSIYRRDGSAVVSAAAVTLVSGVATYAVQIATLASETRASDYQVEWTLSVSGVPGVYRRSCVIGRSRLHPVIDDTDLISGRHAELASLRPAGSSSYQDYLDESWEMIVGWLRKKGTFEHLVLDAESLRLWHLYQTYELIFNDFTFGESVDEKWERQRARYEGLALAERDGLTLKYDSNDDGAPDETRRPVTPVTFLAHGGIDPWGGV